MKYLMLFIISCYFSSVYAQQNQNVSQGLVFDGEPSIAVNPQNSQHIVVAWMGYKFNEIIVIKTKTSSDGGNTWSSAQSIPHMAVGNQSADVSVEFDHLGNVFMCFIDYNNTTMTNGAIYVVKSSDGGSTWGTPVEAISITDCPNKYCIDRPWMEIDKSSGPNQGTIYVTSMNADRNVAPPYNPYLSVSTDGGVSFQTPRFLDTVNYLAGSAITQPMPSPAIGADGVFYGAYPSYETSQSLYATIILASSVDAGNSLDHDFIAYGGNGTAVTDPLAKKASLFITDDSDPDHLAMIILAEYNGDADIFLTESYDKGINWTVRERVNQDPISNGVLQDLVWADFNNNGDLVITWRDRRSSGNSGYQQPTEIYAGVRFADSSNFDEMILSSQIVAHDTILEGKGNDFMDVQLVGDTLYAVWGDMRANALNIYMVKTNIVLGTSSVANIHQTKILDVYPNPASDRVYVKDIEEGEEYSILDMNGKVIHQGNYNDFISINKLSKGMYYILIHQEEQMVKRFVVK